MRHLILATALLVPLAAHAQPAQFCVSPSLAQTIAAALQQDTAVLAMLNDSAQEPQRQAAVVAAAVAKQKTDDEALARKGAGPEVAAPSVEGPNLAPPVTAPPSTKP